MGHHEQVSLKDGLSAYRDIKRRLADAKADLGLEELPCVFDQVDDCDRSFEDKRRDLGDLVEGRLRRRIEDTVAPQCAEAIGLVPVRGPALMSWRAQ